MPTPVPIPGTGTSLSRTSSTQAFLLTNIDFGGRTIPKLDTTHMGTTVARTCMSGDLYENDAITADAFWDPSITSPTLGGGSVAGLNESFTITFPKQPTQTVAANWVFSGFVSALSGSVPLEGLMTQKLSIQPSGVITENLGS